MFIRDVNGLTFIKSTKINVFPCGRRRSVLIDADNDDNTVSDRYYLPFDPEARLNTEANNRKHSGLNGFKPNYINYWNTDGILSFVIAGYVFTIDTGYEDTVSVQNFGTVLAAALWPSGETGTAIYANIKTADMTLMSANGSNLPDAITEILRDQSAHDEPSESLDLLADNEDPKDANSYYFYGLSFSGEAQKGDGFKSLQLLDPVDGAWVIHEAARLPKIDHGDTPGSVYIPGDLYVDGSVTANNFYIDSKDNGNISMVGLKVEETAAGSGVYQLKFYTK